MKTKGYFETNILEIEGAERLGYEPKSKNVLMELYFDKSKLQYVWLNKDGIIMLNFDNGEELATVYDENLYNELKEYLNSK
jgi:hypothetical protein